MGILTVLEHDFAINICKILSFFMAIISEPGERKHKCGIYFHKNNTNEKSKTHLTTDLMRDFGGRKQMLSSAKEMALQGQQL